MLHTQRDSFKLAILARFLLTFTIAIVLLPPAAHAQSLKDKCEKAAHRYFYMETQLKNGKILIAGGFDSGTSGGRVVGYNPNPVGKAEICDPTTGNLSPTGTMVIPRCCASATLLQNGQVLIAGGTSTFFAKSFDSAEVYDPATGTFTAVGNMTIGRSGHTATLLRNGRVLIAGGSGNPRGAGTTPIAELYNPDMKSFEPTGKMHSSRAGHTATLTPEGKVLMVGGHVQGGPYGMDSPAGTTELYDSQTGTFSLIGSGDPP
jgi:Kelch motif protein